MTHVKRQSPDYPLTVNKPGDHYLKRTAFVVIRASNQSRGLGHIQTTDKRAKLGAQVSAPSTHMQVCIISLLVRGSGPTLAAAEVEAAAAAATEVTPSDDATEDEQGLTHTHNQIVLLQLNICLPHMKSLFSCLLSIKQNATLDQMKALHNDEFLYFFHD